MFDRQTAFGSALVDCHRAFDSVYQITQNAVDRVFEGTLVTSFIQACQELTDVVSR